LASVWILCIQGGITNLRRNSIAIHGGDGEWLQTSPREYKYMKSLLCIASLSVAIVASPAAFAQNALGVGTGISNSRSTSAAVANPVQNNRNTATAASASQSRSNSNSNLNSNIRSTTVSANQSSAGNSNTFNSTTTGLAPAVFAPGMSAAGIESCNGSISLGGSAVAVLSGSHGRTDPATSA
jgi:hypothetical protein